MRIGLTRLFNSMLILLCLINIQVIAAPDSEAVQGNTDWENVGVSVSGTIPTDINDLSCAKSSVEIVKLNEFNNLETKSYIACVFSGSSFRIAKYKGGSSFEWAAKKAGDSKYIHIANVGINEDIRVGTGTDRITYFSLLNGSNSPTALTSVDDGEGSLLPKEHDALGRLGSYEFKPINYKKWFTYFDGARNVNAAVVDYAYSPNGRYLVAWIEYRGYVMVDFQENSAKAIFNAQSAWMGGPARNSDFGLVSDDGRNFFIGGSTSRLSTQHCGYDYSATLIESGREFQNTAALCKAIQIGEISQKTGYMGRGSNYRWIDNKSFGFLYSSNVPFDGNYIARYVIITNDMGGASKLDYLALGDSYSSGEGDIGRRIDGKSFYLPTTDYKGGCHVSTRSYPFLLKANLYISDDRMKSVACSGARVSQDYFGDSTSYHGQGDRIKQQSVSEQETTKQKALEDFTPGILKQLDLIKENKPKLVTLTGGGNDVGFASILTYCALPSGVGEISNTCDMALGGTKQRSLLGDAITSQYEKTFQLIAAIKAASRNTKIYIVGYPSFAAEDKNTCLNAAMLNSQERTMINRSVTYLNSILSQAAKAGGAFFVDIEKSLYGGRICEGSSFMTGPLNVLGFDIAERKNEMFHPNYLAHEKIAKTITAAGISADGDSPQPDQDTLQPAKPEFFGNFTYVPTFQDKLVRDGAVYAGKALLISISPGLFAANEALTFTIWSDETTLDTQTTDSQGGLEKDISLPLSVKPGYHLLLVEGKSPTGELKRVYQFVEVQDSPNDTDGDGVTNSQDSCEFMISWYDEQTGRDICTIAKPDSVNAPTILIRGSTDDPAVSVAYHGATNRETNQPSQSGSVLGAHDDLKLSNATFSANHLDKSVTNQLAFGIGALLVLLGISAITRLARTRL